MNRVFLTGAAVLIVLIAAHNAFGVVFINEAFVNPAGSGTDDFFEYIELMGTPGKKLDGYGIAFASGWLEKHHPLGSISNPDPGFQEIDEFFSLDGLALGANGILVIAIGLDVDHSSLLPDTSFRPDWTGAFLGGAGPGPMWNGGLDTPGKLSNDGSNTVLLVRNRPGDKEQDCPDLNCLDLRFGKDICHDCELFTPVATTICVGGFNPGDPCGSGADCIMGACEPGDADLWGDGDFDKGQPNNVNGGNTLDMKGASTGSILDDLEVVDEVSYEDNRGWEYDFDGRHVDENATQPGKFPHRHVHALDDPQGFNPDCLTRVDYRTKGAGWNPAPGASGEHAGGAKNWQDTATEQWIRGESVLVGPTFYFSNAANANPDAVQPFMTNVPSWLNDAGAPDFNFATANNYAIQAGRLNLLAVPFIPGDSDRDGDSDQEDIDKIAAVFGDDDWLFSNSFSEAPEGDSQDPALQTRPWDVDATGDNGIEQTDLQWSLNFRGDATGRIVGVTYDSPTPTPAGNGVTLNSNAGVACEVTLSVAVQSGHAADALVGCDIVEITVRGQVTGGANLAAGQENGIMQFVHDVAIDTGGVFELVDVEALGSYAKTRAALESPQGTGGELGVQNVNGYTTSFVQGLSSASDLYKIVLRVVNVGGATLSVGPAALAKFAAAAPGGLKVGHTGSGGNPASVSYAAASAVLTVISGLPTPDVNDDAVEDLDDADELVEVLLGIDPTFAARCDFNCDGSINALDIQGYLEGLLN